MSNSDQNNLRGKKHAGIGVTNLGYSSESYNSLKHNRPQPMRPGSQDALLCPSLDHSGNRRPYWALKE